jgi:hypothetical protein
MVHRSPLSFRQSRIAPRATLIYSWRGERDARIAAEAKIKADEQQVQVQQQNIAHNNQAIAQL